MSEIKITGLAVDKFNEVADLTEKVFNDSFMRDVTGYEDVFNFDNVRVLFDDNKMACSITITPRQLYIEDVIFDAGGIGGVATLPEFRGKGYASEVMKDSIKRMEEVGCDLSFLYPFKESYYAKFGYRSVKFHIKVLDKSDIEKKRSNFTYTIRKYSDEDIKDILEIYKEFNYGRTGTIVRDISYLRLKISQLKALNGEVYVAESNGVVVGYGIVSNIKGDWGDEEYQHKIIEVGAKKNDNQILNELVYYIGQMRLGEGYDKIFFDDIEGVEIDNSREVVEADNYRDLKSITMFKVVDDKSFLNKMTKIFNKRMKKAGYKIRSYQEIINFQFVNEPDKLNRSVKIKYKNEEVIMEEGIFLNILFGNINYYNESIEGSKELKDVLKVLFPEYKSIYWDLDYL